MNGIFDLLEKHGRIIIGAVIGFVVGYFWIKYGLLKTFILFGCVFAGAFIAMKTKDFDLRRWLIEVLSKGENR